MKITEQLLLDMDAREQSPGVFVITSKCYEMSFSRVDGKGGIWEFTPDDECNTRYLITDLEECLGAIAAHYFEGGMDYKVDEMKKVLFSKDHYP